MDHEYVEARHPCVFAGPEDAPPLLENKVTARTNVCDSRMLVSENGKTSAQSAKTHINMNANDPDRMVNAAAVPRSVHPAKFKTPVPAIIGLVITVAAKPLTVSNNTPSE